MVNKQIGAQLWKSRINGRGTRFEKALLRLHEPTRAEDFPFRLKSAAEELLPGTLVGYGFVDLATRQFRVRRDLDKQQWSLALETLIHESPLLYHWKTSGAEPVVRLSDLTTSREFRRSALYQECMRPMGVCHELGMALPLEEAVGGLVAHREGRDFLDTERDAFQRLWPHAVQAYQNARLLEAYGQKTPVDIGIGIVRISSTNCPKRFGTRRDEAWHGLEADGLRVRKLNPIGAVWLARFFPPGIRGSYLPDPLRQTLRAWQQGELYLGALGSWRAASAGDRLIVRAFPDHERRSVLLTLDLLTSFENRLAHNGLTQREGEVLSWVARGKTDPEIALILGASARTVEKHVQRILAKLGVENRTAAALAHV